MPSLVTTRFAPSPTGLLHLGHAYSAYCGFCFAAEQGGRFLLRIEDIDQARVRLEYEAAIFEDLAWLGITFMPEVVRQSSRFSIYSEALERLRALDLLYPCFCTRREIAAEIAAAPSAPQGPDGPIYPGTCRHLGPHQRQDLLASGKPYAWRLDLAAALRRVPASDLIFEDEWYGKLVATPERFGDIVLARKDCPTSYHLSVVIDDAWQEITHVTRGLDLLPATSIHRLLQALLDLPTPLYRHHPLLTDEAGRRLAKRDQAKSLRDLRQAGVTAADIIARFPEESGCV